MSFYPSWKSNITVFFVAISLVVGYFFWQLHQASYQFKKQSHRHSKVLAAVVELNINTAAKSVQGMDDIVGNSLKNSAQFIHYLDLVENFTIDELTAFATESGLAGVKIFHGNNAVSGPHDWLPNVLCQQQNGLTYVAPNQLYYYSLALADHSSLRQNCVVVGLVAGSIGILQEQLSLTYLLEKLSMLEGIAYIKIVEKDHVVTDSFVHDIAILRKVDGLAVSENYFKIDEKYLVVALKVEHFEHRVTQMKREFALFVTVLCVFGAFSSFYLYRVQAWRLQQRLEFEREMARQHEEAALGRAAATITHEMRNPLNAIGMGLQRLQIESSALDDEHKALLVSMREAVGRSNSIVSSLKQYTNDFQLDIESVDLIEALARIINLYKSQFQEKAIETLLVPGEGDFVICADRGLLGQLFENLVKNALEAQPAGGFFKVNVQSADQFVTIAFTNGGAEFFQDEAEKIFEPYFTNKAKGTGLGLAICKRIAEAHGAELECLIEEKQREITLQLKLYRDVNCHEKIC